MNWSQAAPSILAAFLASLVEFVEALTILLAVGVTRGWRSAFVGGGAAAVSLTILTLLFGPALSRVPVDRLQLVIGVLLILFGVRWLRKAILRSAGVIALHDEDKIFERERAALIASGQPVGQRLDAIAVITSFKAVFLEGLEVIFIVIATGATANALIPASVGAALAGVTVIGIGFAVHRPLARVPENTLKFAVGLILSAFGLFWIGEALHYPWPGGDLSLGLLLGVLFVAAQLGVALARKARIEKPAVRS